MAKKHEPERALINLDDVIAEVFLFGRRDLDLRSSGMVPRHPSKGGWNARFARHDLCQGIG